MLVEASCCELATTQKRRGKHRVDQIMSSCCCVTHLARTQRTPVALDGRSCQVCPAGAAGSCRGRCPSVGAAAGSHCRRCQRAPAQRTAGPSQQGTRRRRAAAAALNRTPPLRLLAPFASSDLRPPRPNLPRSGCDRGARPSPQSTSEPGPHSSGHLRGETGNKIHVTIKLIRAPWFQCDHRSIWSRFQ